MSIDFSRYKVIDYETYSESGVYGDALKPHKAKIFSYCIGHHTGEVDVCRVDNEDEKLNLYNWEKLHNFWADTTIKKIAHNCKYELGVNRSNKINTPQDTVIHDTMIISQLNRNLAVSHALDYLIWELTEYSVIYNGREYNSRAIDNLVKSEAKLRGGYHNVEKSLMDVYQFADGQRPFLLFMLWYEELLNNKKLYADYINEIELIKVTEDMESIGLHIDINNCKKTIEELKERVYEVELETRDKLGVFVNFNSPEQLKHILYNELKLPILKFTKSGAPSTDKDTLADLREYMLENKMNDEMEILDLILMYRSFTKGIGNLQGYIDNSEDNIVYHSILTNRAKTGRQASKNPNLQNVEKSTPTDKNPFPVGARQCFICHPGHDMYFVDYSGIELILIIEASKCLKMIENMKNGLHPHIIFCELFFGDKWVSKAETGELYGPGKNGHFCLCYGGSLNKLASTLSLDIDFVKQGLDSYGKEYPEIVNCVKNGLSTVKRIGYVETVFGRKLWLMRDKLYGWLNYYIQGTAAGILKRAQVNIKKYFNDNWKSSTLKMVLPIHDELVLRIPKNLSKYDKFTIINDISEIMTNMPLIKSPLKVEWKMTSTNWDAAKNFDYTKGEIYA